MKFVDYLTQEIDRKMNIYVDLSKAVDTLEFRPCHYIISYPSHSTSEGYDYIHCYIIMESQGWHVVLRIESSLLFHLINQHTKTGLRYVFKS